MPERRNPVVRTGAILRKGGVHTDSVSGQRHRQKLRVDDAIDEWYDDVNDNIDATPDGADTEFHLGADDRIHRKRHGSKRRSNNGDKKGRSCTAPFSFWRQQTTTTRQYHHSQREVIWLQRTVFFILQRAESSRESDSKTKQ